MTTETTSTMTFTPPGPGTWERDLSHCPPSATPLYRRLASTTMTEAYRGVFAEWGAPLETMEVRFVHGKMYRRLVPLVGADRTGPHRRGPCCGWPPGCTRRSAGASGSPAATLAERAVPRRDRRLAGRRAASVDRSQPRPAGRSTPPYSTTPRSPATSTVDDHVVAGWIRHHQLHGSDLGPIGDLLAHARGGGSTRSPCSGCSAAPRRPPARAAATAGASSRRCAPAGVDPATVTNLDDVRASRRQRGTRRLPRAVRVAR